MTDALTPPPPAPLCLAGICPHPCPAAVAQHDARHLPPLPAAGPALQLLKLLWPRHGRRVQGEGTRVRVCVCGKPVCARGRTRADARLPPSLISVSVTTPAICIGHVFLLIHST